MAENWAEFEGWLGLRRGELTCFHCGDGCDGACTVGTEDGEFPICEECYRKGLEPSPAEGKG